MTSNRHIVEEKHPKWNDKNHFISFTVYFMAWLSRSTAHEAVLEYIRVHEVLVNLSDDSTPKEGSLQDIRRYFFVEESSRFSFGFICDEYGSQSITYLSFLDCTGTGQSMSKAIVCAYAEYISLISSGHWTMHIWADPPTAETPNYLFRNAPTKSKTKTAEELRSMYVYFLSEVSGFADVKPYKWSPLLPPLPSFGCKADPVVDASHKQIVNDFNDSVSAFNALFANTCCVKLQRKQCFERMIIKPSHYEWQQIAAVDAAYWKVPENLINDPSLDFSEDHAASSTKTLIKKMYRTNIYKTMTVAKMSDRYPELWENYLSLVDAFASCGANSSSKKRRTEMHCCSSV